MAKRAAQEQTPQQIPTARDGLARQPLLSSETPLLEWLVALVGLVLVLGVLGYTVYRALQGDASPPDLVVAVDTITPQGERYLITFRVVNHGDSTAAAVTIEGELRQDGETIEVSSATLDFAPSHSERRGGLLFSHNPQQYELQLRAAGYAEP